jgi:DnaK suppressor protein
MTSPGTANQQQASSQMLARRKIILAGIRTQLHGADDEGKLALMNHLEEVGDWAEADLLNDTDIALLTNELAELRDIDAALLRIRAGTYGICIDCGDAIPPERLKAQITAQRCITCQIKADKRHGLVRNSSL